MIVIICKRSDCGLVLKVSNKQRKPSVTDKSLGQQARHCVVRITFLAGICQIDL